MTIGLIGLGSIGERHARNIQRLFPNASLDILTKRSVWKDVANRTRLVHSEKEFFRATHDVYFIANETHKHNETILRCLAQKPRGIFVEKPLSHTLKHAIKISTLVKKQRTVLVVGYNLHYFAPLRELKRLLKKQAIGKILAVRVFVGQDLRAWRKRDYRKSYSASSLQGGGVTLDLIHDLNYPAWLLAERLQLVAGGVKKISALAIDTEDIAEGIFCTPKGTLVAIHQDYLAIPGGRSCELYGTKGTINWQWHFPDKKSTIRIAFPDKAHTRVISHGDTNRMYSEETRDFMRHVRKKDGYTNLSEAIADVDNAISLRSLNI